MSVMLKKLLKEFEPFKRPAVFFEKVSEEQFTKYGGLPIAPKELVWPTYEGFYIPSEDLKKRKFDDVYMEMQCS